MFHYACGKYGREVVGREVTTEAVRVPHDVNSEARMNVETDNFAIAQNREPGIQRLLGQRPDPDCQQRPLRGFTRKCTEIGIFRRVLGGENRECMIRQLHPRRHPATVRQYPHQTHFAGRTGHVDAETGVFRIDGRRIVGQEIRTGAARGDDLTRTDANRNLGEWQLFDDRPALKIGTGCVAPVDIEEIDQDWQSGRWRDGRW